MSSSNPLDSVSDTTAQSTVSVAGTSITMQQLQQIYSELTGKAESISKYYDDPIHLSLTDIEHLHHCIMQTLEQFNVKSSSCSFTVYYLKNTKDQFNSFDRLQLQIASGTDPVESVLLKYDLLVIPPQLSKPQTYSISVRVVSRLTVERRIREGHAFAPLPRFIRVMARHSGSVEITYVDYAIARTLLTVIDEWFQTIPRSPENKFVKKLQRFSHWIPRISRLLTAIVVGVIIFRTMPHFISAGSGDLLLFGQFLLCAGLGLYSAYAIAGWFGVYTEWSVDSWSDVSFIKLNRADEIEVDKATKENRNNLIKGIVGIVGTGIVQIAAKVIAALAVAYL